MHVVGHGMTYRPPAAASVCQQLQPASILLADSLHSHPVAVAAVDGRPGDQESRPYKQSRPIERHKHVAAERVFGSGEAEHRHEG